MAFITIIPRTLQNPFNPLSDLLLPTAPVLWGRKSRGGQLTMKNQPPS